MARRFRGEFVQKLDEKGRVSIPVAFRRVVELGDPDFPEQKQPHFVLVYGDERRNFFECYTIEGADAIDARIEELDEDSPERRDLEEFFNGYSLLMSVDDSGRVVIPERLREKIGIEGEAYFIAYGSTFQIWNKEDYESRARPKDVLDSAIDPLRRLPKKRVE